MAIDNSLLKGSTNTLLLKLLEEKDMYGYEMAVTLAKRSDNTFATKAGTLYPILHALEDKGLVESYEITADNDRTRKYYRLTAAGKTVLREKEKEWNTFTTAVNKVLNGGAGYAIIGSL